MQFGAFSIFYLTLLSPRSGPHAIWGFFSCLFDFIKSSERAARNLGPSPAIPGHPWPSPGLIHLSPDCMLHMGNLWDRKRRETTRDDESRRETGDEQKSWLVKNSLLRARVLKMFNRSSRVFMSYCSCSIHGFFFCSTETYWSGKKNIRFSFFWKIRWYTYSIILLYVSCFLDDIFYTLTLVNIKWNFSKNLSSKSGCSIVSNAC